MVYELEYSQVKVPKNYFEDLLAQNQDQIEECKIKWLWAANIQLIGLTRFFQFFKISYMGLAGRTFLSQSKEIIFVPSPMYAYGP